MEKVKEIICKIFDEELEKKHYGPGWGWRKESICVLLKKRYNIVASAHEVSKVVGEVSKMDKYKFLMKTTKGYCFPRNEKEWDRYVMGRLRQAEGLMQENMRLAGLFFNR